MRLPLRCHALAHLGTAMVSRQNTASRADEDDWRRAPRTEDVGGRDREDRRPPGAPVAAGPGGARECRPNYVSESM